MWRISYGIQYRNRFCGMGGNGYDYRFCGMGGNGYDYRFCGILHLFLRCSEVVNAFELRRSWHMLLATYQPYVPLPEKRNDQ